MNRLFAGYLNATLLSVVCLCSSQVLTASFSEVYETYRGALDSKNWSLALSSSEEALAEGLRSFDIRGENVANLRMNYARELLRDGQNELAAIQLELSLKSKVANHGRQSSELIDVLVELANSTVATNARQALKYYRRVLKIVKGQGNELVEAKITLNAGLRLAKAGELKAASGYLRDAYGFYTRRYGNGDIRAGLAGLNLGRIEFANEENDEALKMLTSALEAFKSPEPAARQLDSATRKSLVQVLETMEMRDAATEHVIAFALGNAVEGYANPTVLYEGKRIAPLAALTPRDSSGVERVGGDLSVIVYFDVDENGFAVNPTIAESTSKALSKTAIRIVSNRRYSPRIEDGEPVVSRGLMFRYSLNSTIRY